ncbi:MAG: response regulator, partial [Deltaproteobacteria bacterium]|nr:response regulator [Deltaproteobacteria bacterium]
MADQINVLIVDDTLATLEILRRNLENHGYGVQTAGNVGNALLLLRDQPVDLVLTDIKMPGQDGFELL